MDKNKSINKTTQTKRKENKNVNDSKVINSIDDFVNAGLYEKSVKFGNLLEKLYNITIGKVSNSKAKSYVASLLDCYSSDHENKVQLYEEYFKDYKKAGNKQLIEMVSRFMDENVYKFDILRDNAEEEIISKKSAELYRNLKNYKIGERARVVRPAWYIKMSDDAKFVISKGILGKCETAKNTEAECKDECCSHEHHDHANVSKEPEVEVFDSTEDNDKDVSINIGYEDGDTEHLKITKTKDDDNNKEEIKMAKKNKKKGKTKADVQKKKKKVSKKKRREEFIENLDSIAAAATTVKPREGLISRIVTWWKERKVRREIKKATRAAMGELKVGFFERIKLWFFDKFNMFTMKNVAVANS